MAQETGSSYSSMQTRRWLGIALVLVLVAAIAALTAISLYSGGGSTSTPYAPYELPR